MTAPWAAQARVEITLTARRGESVLLTLGIPVLLLLFFSLVDVLPTGGAETIDVLAPGILALAVLSTAMVGLAIATGFERQYGVLKRLGATPLTRPGLLGAKTTGVVLIEVVQLAVLVPLAIALGWRPESGWLEAVAAIALATIAFAGLGLLLAGTLRAEATLAAANGLYIVLLLLGGLLVPLDQLPAGLEAVASVLPTAALADALRHALTDGTTVPAKDWLVLAAWAAVTPLAAARWFRWE